MQKKIISILNFDWTHRNFAGLEELVCHSNDCLFISGSLYLTQASSIATILDRKSLLSVLSLERRSVAIFKWRSAWSGVELWGTQRTKTFLIPEQLRIIEWTDYTSSSHFNLRSEFRRDFTFSVGKVSETLILRQRKGNFLHSPFHYWTHVTTWQLVNTKEPYSAFFLKFISNFFCALISMNFNSNVTLLILWRKRGYVAKNAVIKSVSSKRSYGSTRFKTNGKNFNVSKLKISWSSAIPSSRFNLYTNTCIRFFKCFVSSISS